MITASPVSIFVLIGMIGFLLLSARLFLKFSKLSKHARFDLYPIPKEGGGRGAYGGSYFEETEWWTKERQLDHAAETKDVMKEMLFIRKLFIHQRSLWTPSFLFHAGIYIMFGWSVLLVIAAFWHPAPLVIFVDIVGIVGFAFSLAGALMLLYRRLTNKALQVYTTFAEYFNLVLVLLVLTSGVYVWTAYVNPIVLAHGVLTLGFEQMPFAVAAHLVLLGIMLLYIPLSKMGHYAGKFFSFRSVLWDNAPNTPGSKVDRDVRASAAQPATSQWSAPHTRPVSSDESEG